MDFQPIFNFYSEYYGLALALIVGVLFPLQTLPSHILYARWRKTKGKITEKYITEEDGNKGRSRCIANVKFTFEVAGQSYVGRDQIAFSTYERAFESLKMLGDGGHKIVYYHPKDPKKSSLFLYSPFESFIALGILIFSSVIIGMSFYDIELVADNYDSELASSLSLGIILVFIVGYYYMRKQAGAKGRKENYCKKTNGLIVKSVIESGSVKQSARACVIYEYTVDDKIYQNNSINMGYTMQDHLFKRRGKDTLALASEYHDKYPEGANVVVHYNPKNPQDSVLELT